MSIILYKVKDKELLRIEDENLEPQYNYIVIDKHTQRPKIWVWRGPKSNINDKYFAGVSATAIKSQEGLYGASIEVVEGGSEPEQFPKLDKITILPPSAGESVVKTIKLTEKPVEIKTSLSTTVQISRQETEGSPPIETTSPINPLEPISSIISETQATIEDVIDKNEKEGKKGRKLGVVFIHKLRSLLRDLVHTLETSQIKFEKLLEEI